MRKGTAMKKRLGTFLADHGGATAIEYGALVAVVGLALVIALEATGLSLAGTFDQLKSIFGSAAAGTAS